MICLQQPRHVTDSDHCQAPRILEDCAAIRSLLPAHPNPDKHGQVQVLHLGMSMQTRLCPNMKLLLKMSESYVAVADIWLCCCQMWHVMFLMTVHWSSVLLQHHQNRRQITDSRTASSWLGHGFYVRRQKRKFSKSPRPLHISVMDTWAEVESTV